MENIQCAGLSKAVMDVMPFSASSRRYLTREAYYRATGHDMPTASLAARGAQDEYIVAAPRKAQEANRKIRLYPSGLYVNPLAMRARDVRIEDIAHHLSNLCRYTGAAPYHYSVAQHSVLVCRYMATCDAPLDLQLAGLLHDAGEYLFNDLASPVKHDPRMKWYADLEHETTRMIFAKFGIDPSLLAATKPADDHVFRSEVAQWYGTPEAGHMGVTRWTPTQAEDEFLDQFHQLMGALNEPHTSHR